MVTYKELKKLAEKSLNETDETIRKICWSLGWFESNLYICILKKLGRKVVV